MKIIFSDSFSEYIKKTRVTAITVTSASSGGSCCRIIVPKVRVGTPEGTIDSFNIFNQDNLTIYITKNLELGNSITFSYEKMLGREMIEMHGYRVKHAQEK